MAAEISFCFPSWAFIWLEGAPSGVFLGFLLGGLEAVWLLASGRAKPGEGAHMAFGPALCLGLGISLFYGERIFFWYAGFLAEYAQGDVYYGRY